jgi:hypothetical protein
MATKFDKQEYWRRRNEGLRGQGDKLRPKPVEAKQGEHMVRIAGRITMVNRRRARQKLVDRSFTKPKPGK